VCIENILHGPGYFPSIMNTTATHLTCMHARMHKHGSPICFLGICLRMRVQRAHEHMCGIGIPALQPAAGKLAYQAQCRALWAMKFQYHPTFGSFAPHREALTLQLKRSSFQSSNMRHSGKTSSDVAAMCWHRSSSSRCSRPGLAPGNLATSTWLH
jgi:hypothetical protein